jgi:DNA-binding CsgD family transcriptional regulator
VNFSSALDVAGRYEESVAVALEGRAAAARLGLTRHWSAFLAGNAAESLVTLGRLDEASGLVDETLAGDVSSLAGVHLNLLRADIAAARSTGAGRLLREAERLAARARIGVQEARAGLTPREAEVLVHLAAGRTNRQIAEALYISPRTAGVHVSRILAKLGASTRGEAAAAGRLAGVIDDERVEELLTRSTG